MVPRRDPPRQGNDQEEGGHAQATEETAVSTSDLGYSSWTYYLFFKIVQNIKMLSSPLILGKKKKKNRIEYFMKQSLHIA